MKETLIFRSKKKFLQFLKDCKVMPTALVEHTKDKGVSFWFDEETKDLLLNVPNSDFITRAKQMAGNDIYCLEVAKSLWSEFGDMPINNDDEIEENWKPAIGGHFFKGDSRFEIWQWFEAKFDLSVAKDLMNL